MGTLKIGSAANSALPTGGRLIRLKEAAFYLGMSEWTIRQMAHAGQLKFIQRESGSPMLFDRNDLDTWIEEAKQ